MTQLLPIGIITKVVSFDLKSFFDRLEDKINSLSTKRSAGSKRQMTKVITVGSILLFLAAYNLTADEVKQNNNETSVGIFIK